VKIKISWFQCYDDKTCDLTDLVQSGGLHMTMLAPKYYTARFPLAVKFLVKRRQFFQGEI